MADARRRERRRGGIVCPVPMIGGSMNACVRAFYRGVAAALLIALAGCAGFESPGEGGPVVAAPAYGVGDRWVYAARDGFRAPVIWQETREVTAIDPSGITVRITQKGPSVDSVHT